MPGRRIETRGARAGQQGTRLRTAPHAPAPAPARVPGPRAGRRPGQGFDGSLGQAPRRALSASGVLLVAGTALDETFGSGLGWIFATFAAAAAALVAVACCGPQTWWAFALPPLAIAVVALTARLLLDDASSTGRSDAATSMTTALHWAIDTFPAMAAAEAAALAVLTLRAVRSRRYRRAVHA
ncbi:DUF6542 domain-containing protein [Streptomyces sp. UNOC14_S4]|uniref:DUF6542 domain-containing protein n=1 Tax=Streptomyces sp. UNOC14_S4 TaxID=2872340 RepID=UPI001E5DD6E1|nr:DUF6542 domain-containing protein [Streptomyces sp. UNOC14_S4]MCC3771096.1 hypothetical protein [Streptomyces sp. UNOC14_S4]